jgi:probable phosphoglycerate mutase
MSARDTRRLDCTKQHRMTDLIFIRHGETDWNRQLRFQGRIDVPLNATGHEQARRLAGALADERFDLMFSSDLQRARETAAPLAGRRGLSVGAQPGRRGQALGGLEGVDVAGIIAPQPPPWVQWLRQDAD